MNSVASRSGEKVELAPLSAGAGFERGIRALALASRWVGRGWRGLVKSVGTQAYYLVGPSPWLVRDLGRQEASDGGGGPQVGDGPDGRGIPPRFPERPVKGAARASRRAAPVVGAC